VKEYNNLCIYSQGYDTLDTIISLICEYCRKEFMIKLPRAHSKKSLLRISMLNKRNSLSKLEIFEKSRVIQEQVIHSHQFKHAEVVGAYFPIGSEVNTQQIIKVQLENDKTLALPRIDNDEIIFHKISGKYY